VTYSQFKRWLMERGVRFSDTAKGSHFKVSLGDKTSIFPFHGSKEIGTGLMERIKKDLGLK
jgi:mRNA interferase HicA